MRKSPEIGSGHHTTYFRELDGRIGRWWSTDPVIHAGMSPYSAFDGNPIYYVDPLGADSGCPDCSKEEIEHREANGQVWDEEYGGWTERAAIKKGKAGKHAKKRAAFIKYMISIDYTQADVNTYLKLKKKGNNPIVNNIETRIAEGRYEPIYDPNSPYADKWRASWNSGIYSSDYGRGVSSVVGTMGTVAVVAGPGLAIAASGMSSNVAREIADEVVDQAWEASTGTPSPFITGFSDIAQASVRRTVRKQFKQGISSPGPLLEKFGTPQRYIYNTGAYRIFIPEHTNKHLEELAKHGWQNGPTYHKLVGQLFQESLHAAIDDVLFRGTPIIYGETYYTGENEIIFAPPRNAKELPAVRHFMPIYTKNRKKRKK